MKLHWRGIANGSDFTVAEKTSARSGFKLESVRDPLEWARISDPELIGRFDRETLTFAWRHGLLDLEVAQGEPVIAVTRVQMLVWMT